MGAKFCPKHKERMVYGKCIQYSHYYITTVDKRKFSYAMRKVFPYANIIKWGSCARPSDVYVEDKKHCPLCREAFKEWWETNGDKENFPKLNELLDET